MGKRALGTPGPWVVDVQSPLRVLASDPRQTIVAPDLGPPSNPSCLADARLIAAAPDLLEACRTAVAAMGNISAASFVQAAIDKAETGRATLGPTPDA